MIGGMIIQGKRYNIYDVSACLSMTIGLIFFTLADQKLQPDFKVTGILNILLLLPFIFSYYCCLGVLLVSGALVADAVIGNVQEKQMKLHKASNVEVVSKSFY
jgi:adenosine 3'-phospho 5'-phosphosulfate transporter B3